jgi:acyl CoA:acetate/3-ketoacid CoA transferase beta subunit
VTSAGLVLREVAPGVSVQDVRAATEPALVEAHDLREMAIPLGG